MRRERGLTVIGARGRGRATLAAGLLLAAISLAWAQGAEGVETPLPDPAQEARAEALMQEIRCLVCQGQSIAESHADLARDLRILVREKVAAGMSDADIRAFLKARYGDWILLKPPLDGKTWLLWFGPPLLLLALVALLALRWRRRRLVTPDAGGVRALASWLEGEESDEEGGSA